MALRAVVFDYGMVLTGPPEPVAHAMLERITRLPAEKLDHLYWAGRHAYDGGKLTGQAFWRQLTLEAGLDLPGHAIEQLAIWDTRLWLTENPAMLAWQVALKKRGFLSAIVSNMGDTVHQAMERDLDWLSRFDLLVWSYQLGVCKPDPAIYRYALEKLGTRPEETLFIDDRPVNVEAALALGMKALVFTTAGNLRADLVASGLDTELPLPTIA